MSDMSADQCQTESVKLLEECLEALVRGHP
jgi:hypothetical protein